MQRNDLLLAHVFLLKRNQNTRRGLHFLQEKEVEDDLEGSSDLAREQP